MATGSKLLNQCMPLNYKQGTLYPIKTVKGYEDEAMKPYGNRKPKNAGHVRKAGQAKLRKQLKKELNEELYEK